MATERYERLARTLMEAPDPVRAVASLVGDHEARLDTLADRLHHLECALGRGHAKPPSHVEDPDDVAGLMSSYGGVVE